MSLYLCLPHSKHYNSTILPTWLVIPVYFSTHRLKLQFLPFSTTFDMLKQPYIVGNKVKGRISKRAFQKKKKKKTAKFFEKRTLTPPTPPWYTHVHVFCFLETPVWDSPFFLITDDIDKKSFFSCHSFSLFSELGWEKMTVWHKGVKKWYFVN